MSGGHHGCVRVGCASGCGRGRGRKGVGRAETVAQRHSQAKDNAVCVRVGGRGECVVCGLCERGANGLRVCVRVRVCVCVCVCVCVGMCVCAVCRQGVRAGMRVVCGAPVVVGVVEGGWHRDTAGRRTMQCGGGRGAGEVRGRGSSSER